MLDQVEDLAEGRKSALRTGGGRVMEALRNSPVGRPPSKLQRLAPGSPYPAVDSAMNDSGIVADVLSGPSIAVPPGFENGSGNVALAAGSVASGGVPVLPAFGGAAGNGFPSNPLGEGGLGKVEGMFAAMMSEMKRAQDGRRDAGGKG